jgi:hypothetical protein
LIHLNANVKIDLVGTLPTQPVYYLDFRVIAFANAIDFIHLKVSSEVCGRVWLENRKICSRNPQTRILPSLKNEKIGATKTGLRPINPPNQKPTGATRRKRVRTVQPSIKLLEQLALLQHVLSNLTLCGVWIGENNLRILPLV